MNKINVLFMQSQSFFGSDSMIHSLIMRNLDRDQLRVRVACNAGDEGENAASLEALSPIPDLHVRPTRFGPTLTARSRSDQVKDTLRSAPHTISLVGLANYVRKHKIQIVHGGENHATRSTGTSWRSRAAPAQSRTSTSRQRTGSAR